MNQELKPTKIKDNWILQQQHKQIAPVPLWESVTLLLLFEDQL